MTAAKKPKPLTRASLQDAIDRSVLMDASVALLAHRELLAAAIYDEMGADDLETAGSYVATVTRAIRHILVDGFRPKRGKR